jgi:peptide deformylase
MILKIAQLGQPVLRQVAIPIAAEELASPEFQQLLADMRETLEVVGGVGLAAPQVFSSRRVFLARILPPPQEGDKPGIEVFVNPSLTALSDEGLAAWEGCLSFAELLVLVPRLQAVRVDYFDASGQAKALELAGFPARVVQHEFDHLEGILTIDRAESTLDIVKASEIETVLGEVDEENPDAESAP